MYLINLLEVKTVNQKSTLQSADDKCCPFIKQTEHWKSFKTFLRQQKILIKRHEI